MSLAQPHQWLLRPSHHPTVWTVTTSRSTRTFRILEQLGSGGFGKVYRARDCERNRIVALKVLKFVDGDTLLAFKNEFRSLAGLIHPNLVTLHELLSDGARWFFTMELVDGVDFLAYVTNEGERAGETDTSPTAVIRPPTPGAERKGQRPHEVYEGRLRSTLRQLAEGIHALHEAGKLHRDIKPSNILVTPRGRVKLLDFGLVTEADLARYDDRVVGTAEYMAPEQGAGKESAATDWYSVGVMLYQALTGRLPHQGAWMQLLLEKCKPPRPPGELAPDAPRDLCKLCSRLLAPEPAARPDGAEILHTLGGPAARVSRGASKRSVFEGRRAELATLRHAFRASREERRPQVIHVSGRRGAGKTALVERFLDGLREEGTLVLAGRCCARETVPYKALDGVMDALCSHLCQLSRADVNLLLPEGAWTLAQLFPVLRRVKAVETLRRRHGVVSDVATQRQRALQAMRRLLSNLAVYWPLVLCIDDLQLGDPGSVAMLQELLRPPDPPALLLVLCYRTEEQPESLAVRALRDEPTVRVRRVTVRPR
jgi:serine/threonine protein kinase